MPPAPFISFLANGAGIVSMAGSISAAAVPPV